MPQLQENSFFSLKAVALYDNNSEAADELAFRSGDVLTVLCVDYSGYEGWWLCSLRGKQGICPGNRLKVLNDHDGISPGDSLRKAWPQPTKIVVPKVESYLYDEPKSTAPIQYDVAPSNPLPVEEVERYDIPRPLGPTACPSPIPDSLTLQQYDIPRPPQSVHHQHQHHQHQMPNHPHIQQEEYSVPGEVELAQGVTWLGRLEEEAQSAVRGVLACAVSNWRKVEYMRSGEIRTAVHRMRNSLRELALFARSSAVSCRHESTSLKLAPLVQAVSTADAIAEGCAADLDAAGWSMDMLCQTPDGRNPSPDPLGNIVATAATAQHDVSALASFIQGNATLLFKRVDETPMKVQNEDYDFVAVDCNKDSRDDMNSCKPIVDPNDVKVLKFYGGQYGWEVSELGSAVSLFLESVEQNQPPRVFVTHVKFILLAGEKLLGLVDAASRALSSKQLSEALTIAADGLARALNQVWRCTGQAALHFPNISTVQKMVNSVYTVSDHARQTRHALRLH